jgi:hypothetical protein
MHSVSFEAELTDVFLGHLDSGLILIRIQDSLDFQSATGAGTANEVHHGFIVDQRLTLPVQADEGE